MTEKIIDLVAKGIADGALSRFVFTLAAALMLVYLTVTGSVTSDAALAIIGTILGYYFGAQKGKT
jgi:hypothetical protein